MPRSFWKGAVSFGMVAIPIKLYTATQEKDVSFHLLHKEDTARIQLKRWCPADDRGIEWGDVVRGYEYAPDQYVVLTEEDFEKVPVKTLHTVDIQEFVQLKEIDPVYYERSYYMEPDQAGRKPYALLLKTLQDTGRVAVAKVTLRNKEQLCVVRPRDGVLVMETMYYPDEVRAHGELELPGEDVSVSERELEMARSLVDMLTAEFDPEKYRDEYREALLQLIEQKIQGAEVARPAPAAPRVTDLMAALKESIEQARRRQPAPEEAEDETQPARGRKRAG